MPLLGLLALFVLLPIAELYLIYKVGDLIGIWWTLLLLAGDSVLGSVLLRSQGRSVWRQFNETMAGGRMPHRELQDGVAVIFGAAFLITPGFLTDVLGLALLLPPTRSLILRLARRQLARRVATRVAAGGSASRSTRAYDVDGSATEQPPAAPGRLDR